MVQACLVAGGKFHDFDFARLELLGLLAAHEQVRVTVRDDWEDIEALSSADFIVSYTCDVRPSEQAQQSMRSWVEHGGRWIALHGTNAALDFDHPDGVDAPRCISSWVDTLGSQFIAHPPILSVRIENAAPGHWLVAGIDNFDTNDELYLMEHPEHVNLEVLLNAQWHGETPGFVESDWTHGTGERAVQYIRTLGAGAVFYNTLGHCRGHYDMQPLHEFYETVERCSWELPQYYELLRRSIRWALGECA